MKDEKFIQTTTMAIMILFIFATIVLMVHLISSNQEIDLYKTILKADTDLLEISIDSQQAESYYAEAGYSYEYMDYKSVEQNCRLARNHYFEESQGYKKIKAELKDKEIENELITLYLEKLDLLSEISINMFEACEYFESAAGYYDTYFNTNVPYDDLSYDMGNQEIEMMGEKIRAHDNAVERYNNKLAEFNVELEQRLS